MTSRRASPPLRSSNGISLVVSPGDRIGIIGPNGIGKSTLLRVLAGLEEPDAGRVVRTGAVGYLPQEPAPVDGETVLGYLARRTGVGAAEAAMDELAARLEAEPELAGAYSETLDRFLSLGGEDFEPRARAVLADVGLGPRSEQAMTTLSGGEAAKAALAAILLARFDVFLLDEPTNNLDFAGLDRLELFLDSLAAGVVLVSHDRAFLDRTVTRVVEIEAETRKVHEYAGTWSEYEAARERARAQHGRDYADYVEEKGRYSALLRDRRTQAHQLGGPRKLARQTGGSDRRPTNALRGKVQQAKNHLERLEEVEKPWSPWRLRLDLARGAAGRRDRRARARDRRARLLHARAGVARAALGRPPCDRGAERLRQDDADRRAARRASARRWDSPARTRRSCSAS